MTTYFIPDNLYNDIDDEFNKKAPFDRATIKDVRKDIREALDSMIEEAELPDGAKINLIKSKSMGENHVMMLSSGGAAMMDLRTKEVVSMTAEELYLANAKHRRMHPSHPALKGGN